MTDGRRHFPAWLLDCVRSVKPLLRDSFILSLVLNILAIATPIFVLQVYDRVVFHNGLSTLVGLSIGMLLVLAADFLFRVVRARILQRVALDLDVRLSQRITQTFLHLPLRHLESKPGNYWQRIFHDTEVIRSMVSGGAAIVLSDIPFLLLFLILIGIVASPVLWVVFCFIIAFGSLAFVSQRLVNRRQQQERQSSHTRGRLLAELISGRTTIKALSLDQYIAPTLETAQAEYIDHSLKRARTNDLLTAGAHTLTMASTVTIISFGALAILSHDLTMGGLIAGNMLASRLLQPINQLIGTWKSFGSFKDSVYRLDDLFQHEMDRDQTALKPETIQGRLILDDVSFAYTDQSPPVLKNLRAAIANAGMTTIIGPNGSGKTTLLKILMGLYTPNEGRVLLDNGDLSQYSRQDLSQWIGYAPQETFLMSGSIRENILATFPDATDEDLRNASQFAGLDTFVRLLPKGYDTDVGEAGSTMSGGVRQRIGLARAVLQKPAILLLDEPTSHLDRGAEDHLRQRLIDYAQTNTVVIVSHSPALLSAAQDVLLLTLDGKAKFGPAHTILQGITRQTSVPQSHAANSFPVQPIQTNLPKSPPSKPEAAS